MQPSAALPIRFSLVASGRDIFACAGWWRGSAHGPAALPHPTPVTPHYPLLPTHSHDLPHSTYGRTGWSSSCRSSRAARSRADSQLLAASICGGPNGHGCGRRHLPSRRCCPKHFARLRVTPSDVGVRNSSARWCKSSSAHRRQQVFRAEGMNSGINNGHGSSQIASFGMF